MKPDFNRIKRCTRCILPDSLSDITFDENGVCNHCRQYERDFARWNEIEERKKEELNSIFQKAKRLKRPYDCLVPLSGGKDSTYTLYLANKVYGLKTLSVTFDNGYLSDLAKVNIRNALSSCSSDHIFYTINQVNSEELFKVFVEKTGDFCNACMRGINYSIELASKAFRIPLVIKGSGRRVQYVSQLKDITSVNTPTYFANVIKNSEVENAFYHFARNKYSLELQKIIGGISDILKVKRGLFMRFFTQHIGLYDYVYKPFPEIIDIIKKEMKWDDGVGSAEHLDCEMHDVPFFRDTLRIPNITKYTFYNSGLIRQGLMTREQALKLEESEMEEEEVPGELEKFLKANNITFNDYKSIVNNVNVSDYEPRIQSLARDLYHRFRRF